MHQFLRECIFFFLNQNCSDWKKLLIINVLFWHFQEHTQHKIRESTGQWKPVFSHTLCNANIQKCIPNTVEHLRWNIFMKIVNGYAFKTAGHTDIAISNELRYFEGREIWWYLLREFLRENVTKTLLKVNNKDIRMTGMTSFWYFYC